MYLISRKGFLSPSNAFEHCESFNVEFSTRHRAHSTKQICLPKHITSDEKLFLKLNWLKTPCHWWIVAPFISALSFITHRPEKKTFVRNIMFNSQKCLCNIGWPVFSFIKWFESNRVSYSAVYLLLKIKATEWTHTTTKKYATAEKFHIANEWPVKLTECFSLIELNRFDSIRFVYTHFFFVFSPFAK